MNLSQVVGKISPLLGGVLNAFIPGSGLLVSGLANLFGVSGSDPDDVAAAIQADPEAIVKIKQFEMEHKDVLVQAQTSIRLGAYNREIEVTKATGHRDPILSWLAMLFVGGFFIYSFLLFFVHIDSTAHDIVLLIAGQISGLAFTVAGYYFGGMFKNPIAPVNKTVDLPSPAQTR